MLHWRVRGIVRRGDIHSGVVHGYILVPHYFSFFLLELNFVVTCFTVQHTYFGHRYFIAFPIYGFICLVMNYFISDYIRIPRR